MYTKERTIHAINWTIKKEDKKMSDKEQIVIEAMMKVNKPVRPGDIAKTTGMDSKEVSKIIKELKKSGKVVSPKRCYYALTDK